MAVEVISDYTDTSTGISVTCHDVVVWPPGVQVDATTTTLAKAVPATTLAAGSLVAARTTVAGEVWEAWVVTDAGASKGRRLATVVADAGATITAYLWHGRVTGERPYRANLAFQSTAIFPTGAPLPYSPPLSTPPDDEISLQRGIVIVRPLASATSSGSVDSGEGFLPFPSALRGCRMESIAIWWTDAETSWPYRPQTRYRILAPQLPSGCPDIAVDCTLSSPWASAGRVVWSSGWPNWISRTPHDGWVRNSVPRWHTEWWQANGGDGAVTRHARPESRPREHVTLQHAAVPGWQSSFQGRYCGLRGYETPQHMVYPLDNAGAESVPAYDTDPDTFEETARRDITARGRWRLTNHYDPAATYYTHGDGQVLTDWQDLSWSTTSAADATDIQVQIAPTTLLPPEPSGDIPRSLVFEVELESVITTLSIDWDTFEFSVVETTWSASRFMWLRGAENPNPFQDSFRQLELLPAPYWPWDVRQLALAADDASCAYVAHPGYLPPPHNGIPADTVTDPVITRSGNVLTLDLSTPTIRTADPTLVNESQGFRWWRYRAFCPTNGLGAVLWVRCGNIQDPGTYQVNGLFGVDPENPIYTWTLAAGFGSFPILVEVAMNTQRGSGFGGLIYETQVWNLPL